MSKDYLSSTLYELTTQIGTIDENNEFYPGDYALESLKDIHKIVREDLQTLEHPVAKKLENWNFVQKDLIPLILALPSNQEIYKGRDDYSERVLRSTLKLLVLMTNPVAENFETEQKIQHHANLFEQDQRVRVIKSYFCDQKLLEKLCKFFQRAILLKPGERTDNDITTIDLILVIISNLLRVPDEISLGSNSGISANQHLQHLHVEFVMALENSNFLSSILFLVKQTTTRVNKQHQEWNFRAIHFFRALFGEEDPIFLVNEPFQNEIGKPLHPALPASVATFQNAISQQKANKTKLKHHIALSGRHPKFGGTFLVKDKSGRAKGSLYNITQQVDTEVRMQRSSEVLEPNTRTRAFRPRRKKTGISLGMRSSNNEAATLRTRHSKESRKLFCGLALTIIDQLFSSLVKRIQYEIDNRSLDLLDSDFENFFWFNSFFTSFYYYFQALEENHPLVVSVQYKSIHVIEKNLQSSKATLAAEPVQQESEDEDEDEDEEDLTESSSCDENLGLPDIQIDGSIKVPSTFESQDSAMDVDSAPQLSSDRDLVDELLSDVPTFTPSSTQEIPSNNNSLTSTESSSIMQESPSTNENIQESACEEETVIPTYQSTLDPSCTQDFPLQEDSPTSSHVEQSSTPQPSSTADENSCEEEPVIPTYQATLEPSLSLTQEFPSQEDSLSIPSSTEVDSPPAESSSIIQPATDENPMDEAEPEEEKIIPTYQSTLDSAFTQEIQEDSLTVASSTVELTSQEDSLTTNNTEESSVPQTLSTLNDNSCEEEPEEEKIIPTYQSTLEPSLQDNAETKLPPLPESFVEGDGDIVDELMADIDIPSYTATQDETSNDATTTEPEVPIPSQPIELENENQQWGATQHSRSLQAIRGNLQKATFLFVSRRITNYVDEKNWHALQTSVSCLHSQLLMLQSLFHSNQIAVRKDAGELLREIFFNRERYFLYLLPSLLREYNPNHIPLTSSYLSNLLECIHVIIRLAEKLQKERVIFTCSRTARFALEEEDDGAALNPKDVDATDQEIFLIEDYTKLFIHPNSIHNLCFLLDTFKTNSANVNHYLAMLLLRICTVHHCEFMFYRISVFRIFQRLLDDPATAKSQRFSELVKVSSWIVRRFYEASSKAPEYFAAILFSNTVRNWKLYMGAVSGVDSEDEDFQFGIAEPSVENSASMEIDAPQVSTNRRRNKKQNLDHLAEDSSEEENLNWTNMPIEEIQKNEKKKTTQRKKRATKPRKQPVKATGSENKAAGKKRRRSVPKEASDTERESPVLKKRCFRRLKRISDASTTTARTESLDLDELFDKSESSEALGGTLISFSSDSEQEQYITKPVQKVSPKKSGKLVGTTKTIVATSRDNEDSDGDLLMEFSESNSEAEEKETKEKQNSEDSSEILVEISLSESTNENSQSKVEEVKQSCEDSSEILVEISESESAKEKQTSEDSSSCEVLIEFSESESNEKPPTETKQTNDPVATEDSSEILVEFSDSESEH